MAPPPDHDKEPKAPDKKHSQGCETAPPQAPGPAAELPPPATAEPAASAPADAEESGQVEELNDCQLKALLDEAVTYKRPKDREGKSLLFKELLQEVEQDSDQSCVWGRSGLGVGGASRRRVRGGGRGGAQLLAHSGSLQDLAGELCPERATRHHRRRPPPPVPVSARCLQGGSLPANVDQQNFGLRFLEDVHGGGGRDYIATVRCVNPPPLGEPELARRAPSPPPPQAHCRHHNDKYDTRSSSIAAIPNYTSRATLEIMSGSSEAGGGTGGAVLVDSNKGCIPSPVVSQPLQLASGYSAVKCITGEGGAPGSSAPHLSVFNIKGCNAYPKHDLTNDCKKSLDENSNAIQSVNAGLSSSQHSKKIKRKQKCKNEKESLSNEIDGYRGDNPNIQDILKFIEDTQDTKQTSKTKPSPFNGKISKTKDDDSMDKGAKKRSTERRNKDCNKMDKLKKSNSMEELFRSKLDDLTTTPKDLLSLRKTKKQSTFDQADISDSKRSDRRSWGNDGSDAYFPQNSVSHDADDSFSTNLSNSSSAQSSVAGQTVRPKKARPPKETEVPAVVVEPTMAESSDFQTVTNKKKIRRRHSPIEDNRGRSSNSYNHTQYGGSKNTSRFTSSFPSHDRDTFYKKMGRAGSAERRHPSVSSPPSDKSNDSNDDLDSVHSLPAEASGERLQASYADMARAAAGANLPPRPATNTDNNKTANPAPNKAIWNEPNRPPAVPVTAARPAPFASPPPVVTPKEVPPPITPQLTHMQTQASALPRPNFPDLIESCNYYTNRYVDVSTENTKNLSHKDAPAVDANKTKIVKNNIVDTGTQMDQSPIYNHEQYPALEARSQKPIDIKLNPKTKVDPKVMVTPNSISKGVGGKVTEQKQPLKALSTKEETLLEEHHVQVTPPEHYVAYVNHTSTNNMTPLPTDMCPREVSAAKSTFSVQDRKVDSFLGKPPDVVLPLTTVDISSDNRPAVIIMNEEIRKSSDNIHNIDGITFGFDINQQLINGEVVNTAVADSDNKNAPSEVAEDKRYPRVQMDNTIQIASAENAVNNNANIQRNPQINIQPRNAPTKAQTSNPPPSIPPPAAAPAVADPAVITYNTVEFPSINETHHARQEHHHHAPSAKHQEEAGGAPLQVQVPSARPIRYLPPTNNHKDSYNLDRIVDYVGTAWEDIIKSPSGKVQYFSGV